MGATSINYHGASSCCKCTHSLKTGRFSHQPERVITFHRLPSLIVGPVCVYEVRVEPGDFTYAVQIIYTFARHIDKVNPTLYKDRRQPCVFK